MNGTPTEISSNDNARVSEETPCEVSRTRCAEDRDLAFVFRLTFGSCVDAGLVGFDCLNSSDRFEFDAWAS